MVSLNLESGTGGAAPSPVTAPLSVALTAVLAAGASIDLDAPAVAGATGQIMGAHVASSVGAKWEVKTFDGGVEVTQDVIITERDGVTWQPPDKAFITVATGGLFRVTVTNRDSANAASVYVTIFWNET